MSDISISVYQAASQLGISVHTVRRWCKDFSSHLSEGANPETGTARRLSSQDLAVLAEVSRLRGEGLSTPLIHQRLNETVFPAHIVEASHAAQESRSEAIAPFAVVDAIERIRADLRTELDQRLQPLEQQRLRLDAVWIFAAGIIIGLMIGLSIWWFQ